MVSQHTSFCRNCLACCPIVVTVDDGRAVKVVGDPESALYDGYTCPKGRALPEQHNDPMRLLHCLKQTEDGRFAPIESHQAVSEIADKLKAIIERDGPRAVAVYSGTGVVSHPTGRSMSGAFLNAIKSPMMFSAATIDKPAAHTSTAMHGNWVAGAQPFEESDTLLLIGANPVIAKSNGAPFNNPGKRLKDAVNRGMKLIVIDPRRTETARRAHIHLQAWPGEDPVILAAMINVIIGEKLYDAEFVQRHAQGFEALAQAVKPYTLEFAAGRSGVEADQIREAARTFGRARKGGAICSTGPSFSTRSNLSFYLALCLNTLCGRWGREGDIAAFPNALLPAFTPKAQAYPPYPPVGETAMRVRGLKQNASGMPTAALSDEILMDGPGQVKALFCVGGNPMLAWPDQARTEAALRKLELLVVFDYHMTATADLAHYVIASPLSLEVPAATNFVESLKYTGVTRGFEQAWAQYAPKVVDPPDGSDLMDDREFFFRMAQHLGLQLEWINNYGYGPHVEASQDRFTLDMSRVPSVDELLELSCRRSRIPLDLVKKYPHGHVFEEVSLPIEPADAECKAKLELGDARMMGELGEVLAEGEESVLQRHSADHLLVCRRANNFMNSVGQSMPILTRDRRHNPVFMNPAAMARMSLNSGDKVAIRSSIGEVRAIVEADETIKSGVIAMTHGFGVQSIADKEGPEGNGSSVTQLVSLDEADPMTGIPRMSAIPVSVTKIGASQ